MNSNDLNVNGYKKFRHTKAWCFNIRNSSVSVMFPLMLLFSTDR